MEWIGEQAAQHAGTYSHLRRRRSWGTPASRRRQDRPGPPSLPLLNELVPMPPARAAAAPAAPRGEE